MTCLITIAHVTGLSLKLVVLLVLPKNRGQQKDTTSIEKHVFKSEREGAPSGHERS